ncbi:chemotaxis protein CheD [Aliikangiella sp. IMCC44632]
MGVITQSILIHPGEIAIEQAPIEIKTLLGSCVALTAWHPQTKVGGICHYQLPKQREKGNPTESFRYGECALPEFKRLLTEQAPINEYQIGLYGGANLFAASKLQTIGSKNLKFAKEWLNENQLTLVKEDSGESFCRNLSIDLNTGVVSFLRYSVESEAIFQ